MEARIRQLTQLLENATIGETPADDGVVEPGMVVTVEMFGDEETFLLGSREIADDSASGLLRAVAARRADQRQEGRRRRQVLAPDGKTVEVKILKAASPTPADASAQQRRRVAVRPQGPEHLFTVFGAVSSRRRRRSRSRGRESD